MKTLLIDNQSTLLPRLNAALPGEVTTLRWDKLEGLSADPFDLVILSGGSAFDIVHNEALLKSEIALIVADKKPLIGICFGCELVAEAFGGTLEEMDSQKKGTIRIQVDARYRDIFDGMESFEVYENHRWRIKDLPADFEVMASSDHGPEIIRHKSLPIFGLQFHPEKAVENGKGEEILKLIIKSMAALA